MASERIFKIKAITDCLRLEFSENLQAVFSREGVLKRQVHSVWGCPGHLFVSLEGGTLIRAYQAMGATRGKQFTLLAKISPVVKICFAHQDAQNIILIIHQNGLVKVYEHIQPKDDTTHPWKKRAQFTLDTYKNKASVKSAIYSASQGSRLVWVEERKESGVDGGESVHYCLLTASLDAGFKGIKEVTQLVSHCPTEFDIAVSHDGQHIAVLPRQPSPPGMYFKLHTSQSDGSPELATSIVGEGCVRRDTSFPVNFRDHVDSLAHLWSKAADKPACLMVAMAMDVGSGHLLLISQDGTVHVSTTEDEELREFQISDVNAASVSSWFVHRLALGAVFPKEGVIRLYSTTSGALLQEVNISQLTSPGAEVIRVWSILGSVPQVGVWTDNGIWLIQMQDGTEAAKTDTANTVEHLLTLGQDKMAAATQLQRVYSLLYEQGEKGGEEAVCDEALLEKLFDSEVFQNDALLVSLIQGLDERQLPQFRHKLRELQQRFEQRKDDQPDTSLNEAMLPLLQDFWTIQRQRDQAARSELTSRRCPTVTQEVREALSKDSRIPVDLRLDRLDLLSQLFPEKVLDCLLKELDIEKAMEMEPIDASASEQATSSSPYCSLCTADTDDGCRFLRLLCQLVFLHQPEKLVKLLDFFQQCQQTASDTSAFTRRKRGMSVNGMILESLPDPTQSTDTKQAALATAHLIQTSDKEHGPMRALHLLLKYCMWEDAIGVVETCDQPDSQTHKELFYVLLSAMLTDGADLQTYSQRIWACLPPSISSLNLLQTLQINQDNVQSQIGVQQAIQGQGLTTALLKEQLHKMLAQESA